MRNASLILPVLGLLCASCSEDELPTLEPVSEIPAISLLSVGPSEVVAWEDSIIFLIHYQDGDGDLGFNSPDSLSLYVTDDRIGLTESYFVPLLAPEGAGVAIQGELEVELKNTILIDPDADNETVTFSIYLRDRAGNISNTITAGPITVTRN